MQMLSEDDVNLRELSDEELDRAWDLWFDLAQATNDWDPPYSHGVFVNLTKDDSHVKPPLITIEETVDRIVGKRTKAPDGLSTATSRKAESVAWSQSLGGVRVPRGVYRFKTHEDADRWLWRMITRSTS